MTYRVIKTVNGHQYVYEQRTWREGKRVRTESRYIGPVADQPPRRRLGRKISDFIKANMTSCHEFITGDTLAQFNARVEQEEHARLAKLDDLYGKYGLRVSGDKPELRATSAPSAASPMADQDVTQHSNQGAGEDPSVDEGSGIGRDAPAGSQNN